MFVIPLAEGVFLCAARLGLKTQRNMRTLYLEPAPMHCDPRPRPRPFSVIVGCCGLGFSAEWGSWSRHPTAAPVTLG